MTRLQLAITLETLGLPVRQAMPVATRAGLEGIVFDAVGPLAPDQLSDTGRRELRQLFLSHRLATAAIRCPLRRGLDEPDGLEARIERLRRAMQLAFDVGPRLVLLGIGPIPPTLTPPLATGVEGAAAKARLTESLAALARYGDKIGCRIALDAGYDPAEALESFLSTMDTGMLGFSLDPGLLLMEKQPMLATLQALAGRVWHAYARDAQARRLDRGAQEVGLGQGDVDWFAWLGGLEEIGYSGWLTIRQPKMSQPASEALAAVQFLRRLGVGAGR
jgi:L-ribulose-5-phosphate 3-epimerase